MQVGRRFANVRDDDVDVDIEEVEQDSGVDEGKLAQIEVELQIKLERPSKMPPEGYYVTAEISLADPHELKQGSCPASFAVFLALPEGVQCSLTANLTHDKVGQNWDALGEQPEGVLVWEWGMTRWVPAGEKATEMRRMREQMAQLIEEERSREIDRAWGEEDYWPEFDDYFDYHYYYDEPWDDGGL